MTVYDRRLNTQLRRRTQRALFAGGSHLKNAVVKNLSQGTRTGRTYRVPGTNVTYTASRPGEYPALRTGALSRSYELSPPLPAAITDKVVLGSRLPYAPILENKLNRRHLRRTYEDEKDEVIRIMKRAFNGRLP